MNTQIAKIIGPTKEFVLSYGLSDDASSGVVVMFF
jgi:hypothetical protein